MRLFFWRREKKKKYERVGDLEMRLHVGMMDMKKENVVLHKHNKLLHEQVIELERTLAAMALERDMLRAWWEKYKDKLEEMEAGDG